MSSNQLPLFEGSSSSTSQAAKHSEKNARKLSIKADLNADELKQLMHQLQLHVRQYDPRAQVAEITQTANTASSNCVDASQKQSWIELPFVCVDCETTGLDPRDSRVIEVAWVHMQQCNIVNTQNRLCNIPDPLPEFTVQMTGITDEMLQGQPAFCDHADELIRAIQNAHFVVAYNADFDKRFLESELQQVGKSLPQKPWVDP
ncbi:MAG: exonuclease domain-containing protein, partial [Myxococcota bacterium]